MPEEEKEALASFSSRPSPLLKSSNDRLSALLFNQPEGFLDEVLELQKSQEEGKNQMYLCIQTELP